MTSKTSVWTARFERLRDAGITSEQAEVVFGVLNDARAFGSERMFGIALGKLREVFKDAERVVIIESES